jgi:hypothetical protein
MDVYGTRPSQNSESKEIFDEAMSSAAKKIAKKLHKADDGDSAWAALGALEVFNAVVGGLHYWFSDEDLEQASYLLERLNEDEGWLDEWESVKDQREVQDALLALYQVVGYYEEGAPPMPEGNPR